MAVYKIFPQKDATIYSLYPTLNTGLDSIIEATITPSIETFISSRPQASRFLIQFSQSELLDIYTTYLSGSSSYKTSLKTYAADVVNLSQQTILQVLTVSGSWNNGTGKYGDIPETRNGVSWTYRSEDEINDWVVNNYPAGSTGSYDPQGNPGGGNWYTSATYSTSQSFEYKKPVDLNVDVTNTFSAWVQGTLPNEGFIVKQKDEFIDSLGYAAVFKYFSVDTNTIYPPELEVKWNDFANQTNTSIPEISGNLVYVSLSNNPGYFQQGSRNVFRVNVRPKFPPRVFQVASLYTNAYYLPLNSYYAVKDLDTDTTIIDFDTTYTKISRDLSGNYFTLFMNGLEPERYYKILIKSEISGNIFIFDEQYYFKVLK